jgi:hypothetical protein
VPCRDFLQRLAAADATLYFNSLLEMELAETAFRIEHSGSRRESGTVAPTGCGRASTAGPDSEPAV